MTLEKGNSSAVSDPNLAQGPAVVETGTQAQAEQGHALPVTGHWFKPYRGEQVLELGIIDNESVGGIRGALAVEGPLRGQIKIQRIEVFDTNDRGKGLGKRLMQSFAAEAKMAGATELAGDILSAAEIHNRLQVFGEDNVTFYEKVPAKDSQTGVEVELPLTRYQAIESLRRAEQAYEARQAENPDDDEPEPTISARTDLTVVDTSGWELPAIGDVSLRPNLGEQIVTAQEAGRVALAGHQ